MAKYMNEAEYLRWFRPMALTLNLYMEQLLRIHLLLDKMPDYKKLDFEAELNELETKLDESTPRDFTLGNKPLLREEKFAENMKVVINLFFRILKKEEPFEGIYQAEKDRVLGIQNEIDFKTKLTAIEDKLISMHKEITAEQQQTAALLNDENKAKEEVDVNKE